MNKFGYKSMKKKYNKTYFENRDVLILHMAEVIKDLMIKNKLKSVLDVGCGSGLLVKYLRQHGFQAEGCDVSAPALKMARIINPKSTIKFGSAGKLPYKSETFDMITAVSVIEHLSKKEAQEFFKEAYRVVKKGKLIFLVTPNFSTPLRIIQGKNWFGYSDPTHINYFRKNELDKILKKHGFSHNVYQFKLNSHETINWEFPPFFAKLPKIAKLIAIYFFFSSPFSILRNSLWVFSKKIDAD